MIKFDFNDLADLAMNDYNRLTFEIIITKKCNSNCPHCFMEGSQDGVITKDIIDIALEKCKKLKDDNWIELFGGEPMLEPELCAYTSQKAHELGLKVSLYTNGYWGNSQKLMEYVCNEIKPDFILMSIDDFHTIPDSSIMSILEFFNNGNTPKIGISAVKDHCSKLETKFLPAFPDLNVYYIRLHEVGKSVKYENNEKDYCRIEGWIICPDGDVRMACEKGYKACRAGNIKTLDIVKAYDTIKDMFLAFMSGTHLYDFCNKNTINIFDKSTLLRKDIKIMSLAEITAKKSNLRKAVLTD